MKTVEITYKCITEKYFDDNGNLVNCSEYKVSKTETENRSGDAGLGISRYCKVCNSGCQITKQEMI